MELQRGSRVGAELQIGRGKRVELHGGSRVESGIKGRVKGRGWNYREG